MKAKRQKAIKEIVKRKKIGTQEELVLELRRRGFVTTQATVSRDIGEIGLKRGREQGVLVYALPKIPSDGETLLKTMVRDFVVDVAQSMNLVVVKTSPGTAQGVAAGMDNADWEEVLGTVAGDDTILAVAKNNRAAFMAAQKFKKLMDEE
ncbi:MAG: arginine repressor [Terriglobia bacterium]